MQGRATDAAGAGDFRLPLPAPDARDPDVLTQYAKLLGDFEGNIWRLFH